MEGRDKVCQILKLAASISTKLASPMGALQDDTVTEPDDEVVADNCQTPEKEKDEEHTAPSSNEKVDLPPRMQEVRLFTDAGREQQLKEKKIRTFGPKLSLETLKAGGKKRTQEMRENIERMYQAAEHDSMLRRDRNALKAKAQRKEEELEAIEEELEL